MTPMALFFINMGTDNRRVQSFLLGQITIKISAFCRDIWHIHRPLLLNGPSTHALPDFQRRLSSVSIAQTLGRGNPKFPGILVDQHNRANFRTASIARSSSQSIATHLQSIGSTPPFPILEKAFQDDAPFLAFHHTIGHSQSPPPLDSQWSRVTPRISSV